MKIIILVYFGRAGTLDLHQVPCRNINAQLVAQGGLPRVLVGREDLGLFCDSFLRDAKVSPVDYHHAVVAHKVGPNLLLKSICS